jgi:hypothetical protein
MTGVWRALAGSEAAAEREVKMRFRFAAVRVALACAALAASAAPSLRAQQPRTQAPAAKPAAPAPQGQKAKEQPTWRLRVTKDVPALFSLKSKDAPLTEIAAELKKEVEIPFLLSPVMQKQRVTADFAGQPLEAAVRLLAPQVFIDYEVSGDPSAPQRPVGVYLYAFNEAPPERTAVVKGGSEAMLIEGHTEEGTEGYEKAREQADVPLRVKFEQNQWSVRARKQPLTVVLYEIAGKIDIPFEMKYDSTELIDVDFNNYTLDQVVRSLSPNVKLYVRTNLLTYEMTPLRLVLLPPANARQAGKN